MRQTKQEKQDEKSRLAARYRKTRREQWELAVAQEPRLEAFQHSIKSMENPREILQAIGSSWIMEAPVGVRYWALRLVDAHANAKAKKEGRQILDDPMPPRQNLYIAARELLGVR